MTLNFHDCLVPYQNHGIQFSYPDIWHLTEEMDGMDVIVTVSANETLFWTLRILPACPPPPQVVESCVSAFEEEYDEVEVEESQTQLASMPAYSRDLEFFCMELTNSVGLRSVRTTDFTLLVWWRGTSHELDECQEMLDHMTQSVQADSLID